MSKLDELLRELCPNGVEYKKLGEIATISRGGNFQKKDFLTEGVPCIHYGQIYTKYGLFTDKTFTFISEECAKKQKMAQPNDIVMAVTSENIVKMFVNALHGWVMSLWLLADTRRLSITIRMPNI